MTSKQKRLEEAQECINQCLKRALEVEESSLLAEYIFSKNPTIMEGEDRQSKVIILEIPLMEYSYLKSFYDKSKRTWEDNCEK